MNYRYRAMTQDGQKLQGSLMLTMNVRHDCGCVKKGFPAGYSPPKKFGSKNTSPEDSHSELTLFTRQLATLSAAAYLWKRALP